jgi:hypothetical protein
MFRFVALAVIKRNDSTSGISGCVKIQIAIMQAMVALEPDKEKRTTDA